MQVKSPNKRSVEPHEAKVDITLTKLKPLDARWVVDYHNNLQPFASVVKNGFWKAKILEAFTKKQTHPFTWKSFFRDNYWTLKC